jgi:hypothetical protein
MQEFLFVLQIPGYDYMSERPYARRLSNVRSKIVLPPIFIKHFGLLSVKGRSLADTPAAKITDFIYRVSILMLNRL